MSAKLDYPDQLDINWLANSKLPGFTSGASVQDRFLEPVIDKLRAVAPSTPVIYQEQAIEERDMTFTLPEESLKALRARLN